MAINPHIIAAKLATAQQAISNGATVSEAAKLVSLHPRTLRRNFSKTGFVVKIESNAKRPRYPQSTGDEVAKMFSDGISKRDIGEKFSISNAVIDRMLKARGIDHKTIEYNATSRKKVASEKRPPEDQPVELQLYNRFFLEPICRLRMEARINYVRH